MARATRFPVDAFERDRLPEICILSGEPTGDRLRSKVSSRPDVLWLLLFGIVPYVIARAILTKTVSGTLPVSEDVYVVIKARRRLAHPFYVVGLAVLVLGVLVLAASPRVGVALAFLGLGVIVIGGVYAEIRDPLRRLELDASGRWIELPNAADQFAETVAARLKAGDI